MRIIRSISRMQQFALRARRAGRSIGFVPTMGALHEGHLSLIRRARKENDLVVVSIFVNPIQFGAREDFKKYPRNVARDCRLCRKEKVDIVFLPSATAMYPSGYKTFVQVEGMSDSLCGKARPGHFRGATTVVNRLFTIVNPDCAYFGQKDVQQAVIIKKMVSDLNMPVKLVVMPTVRQPDGLAMSSRNAYLKKGERKEASVLFRSLCLAAYLIKRGARDCARVIRTMRRLIQAQRLASIDYIAIVDAQNLMPLEKISRPCLVALAVRFGKTRLIDNILIR